MTFTDRLNEDLKHQRFIQNWIETENERFNNLYTEEKNNLDRIPKEYSSNMDALLHLQDERDRKISDIARFGRRTLTIADVADVLVNEIAMTVRPDDEQDTRSLMVYDYDAKMYKHSMKFLNDCLVMLYGQSSNSILSSLIITLSGMWYNMAEFFPLPRYKIAVGNGIFNLITKELEPFTPKYTVLEKISTNYIKDAVHPVYNDKFTFEGMVNDFTNNNENRKLLLYQIFKSIVTGVNISPGLFIILGKGGDGKSTMFQMIANMIGKDNVAYLSFRDFESHDKLITAMNKKLILGLDNGVKLYIKDTTIVKKMASHETLTISRKYLSAITFQMNAVVVQLCNEMPRFSETGNSMKRRLIPYKAEKNFNQLGIENRNIDSRYIYDKKFLEYVLKFILDDIDYYSDYNDVDRKISEDALESEDLIGQFLNEITANSSFDSMQKIPISHLYASYKDWMAMNNAETKPFANRTFIIQAQNYFSDLGLDISDVNDKIRPETLEAEKQYNQILFHEWKDMSNFRQSKDLNSASRYFFKSPEKLENLPRIRKEVRRNDKEIDIVKYLKYEDAIPGYRLYQKALSENSVNNIPVTEESTNDVKKETLTIHDFKQYIENKNKDIYIFIEQLKDKDYYDRTLGVQDDLITVLNDHFTVRGDPRGFGFTNTAANSEGEMKISALENALNLLFK